MENPSNYRNPKEIKNDFYETNQLLLKLLVHIYKKYHKHNYLSIDPAVGRGCVYKQLFKPKAAYDISKTFLTANNKYTVKDFLQVSLKTDPKNTIVVGNPPFRSCEKRHLYLDFINHASNFCHTVIFIVPLSAMKQKNIQKVYRLSLAEVYFLPDNVQYFTTLNGDIKKVKVCIQVYKKLSLNSFQNEPKSNVHNKDFIGTHLIYKYPRNHFDFFVRRLDSLKNLGKVVTKYPYTDDYLKKHPNTTGWMGIKVLNKEYKKNVLRRFIEMYKNKEIEKYLENTSIGNWNDLNFFEVLKIYYKTIEKPNFKTHYL